MPQRAYTARLRPYPEQAAALWHTHCAVNRGARAFGEALLTLRGGLPYTWVAEIPITEKRTQRPPTAEEQRWRRRLLSLCWLTVEDTRHAPGKFSILLSDVPAAFRQILVEQGVPESERQQWETDCLPALNARIRDDGTWVNRHAAFREFADAVRAEDAQFSGASCWDMLQHFFGSQESFLSKPANDDDDSTDRDPLDDANCVQGAIHFLCDRLGSGTGAAFDVLAERYSKIGATLRSTDVSQASAILPLIADAVGASSPEISDILARLSATGHKSATRNRLATISATPHSSIDRVALAELSESDAAKCGSSIGKKGRLPYATHIAQQIEAACGIAYTVNAQDQGRDIYCVMLDHAARRVSGCHSWIKNAEAAREKHDTESGKLKDLQQKHPAAFQWLRDYCERRTEDTGALEDYRIRRRAVGGWKEIVARWSQPDCSSEADRIAAARELQDTEEKFGDIQLFEALAADDAAVVWRAPEGGPDVLRHFVLGTDAEAQSKRLKVPLFRHPDELAHPLYVDFGDSRPGVVFHAAEQLRELRALESKLAELPPAGTGDAKQEKERKRREKERAELLAAPAQDRRSLSLDVIRPDNRPYTIELRWTGSRLASDLGLNTDPGKLAALRDAPRNTRLGRAAAGLESDVPIAPLAALDKKKWNARLQAPRDQLDAIDRAKRDGKPFEAKITKLSWFLSTSPDLPETIGPWKRLWDANPTGPDDRAPHVAANKVRAKRGRLELARIPGLRVLGVDLGLRHAAACTVWRVLSSTDVADLCKTAGRPLPSAEALHDQLPRADGKPGRVVLRRIGGDTLPDGRRHPAPWALLERQFLVKLPGEDEAPRVASPTEIAEVRERLAKLGRIDAATLDLPRDIGELMGEGVTAVQRGLNLARDLARAVCGLTAAADAKAISAALVHAHRTATGDRWRSAEVAAAWQRHLGELPVPPSDRTRKKREESLLTKLAPAAQRLVAAPELRAALIADLRIAWERQSTEVQSSLRWLRRWLMPRIDRRGFHDRLTQEEQESHLSRLGAARHLGGLSLDRLALLESLWRTQKAFAMRPTPDNLRANIPGEGDNRFERFGQRLRDTFEQLRENRVRQLASRLAEAALGLGAAPERDTRFHLNPGERRHLAARASVGTHPVCHAIVIERLDHYRPDETRLRRENRGLQQWAAGQLKKQLSDQCELHGLFLRDVTASYTSRQDARTGAPGLRCVDVPVADFVAETGWWAKRRENVEGAEQALMSELFARWQPATRTWTDRWGHWTLSGEGKWQLARRAAYAPDKKPTTPLSLRLPQRGGDLFVSAADGSPDIQADLNASANIGLRPLLDPDWSGTWWHLLAEPLDAAGAFRLVADDIKGSAAVEKLTVLSLGQTAAQSVATTKRKRRQGDTAITRYNLWRDPAGTPLPETGWQLYTDYQRSVLSRVCDRLRRHNSDDPAAAQELV